MPASHLARNKMEVQWRAIQPQALSDPLQMAKLVSGEHARDDPPLVHEILVGRYNWADHCFVQMRGQCLLEKGLGVAVIWVKQANKIPARPIVAREKSMNLADVLSEGVETYSRVRYRADACFQPLPVSCFRSVVDDNAFPVWCV